MNNFSNMLPPVESKAEILYRISCMKADGSMRVLRQVPKAGVTVAVYKLVDINLMTLNIEIDEV